MNLIATWTDLPKKQGGGDYTELEADQLRLKVAKMRERNTEKSVDYVLASEMERQVICVCNRPTVFVSLTDVYVLPWVCI